VKIGSLCTGYGGLDMAVEAYFNAEMVWCAENDKYASALIEQRFNKPNLGDIKQIDWDTVKPIDILTAGYPCQPFSHAGQRKGTEDERHIWPYIIKAISTLRPKYIILENVRGHLSLGFSTVLANLTQIGYDARWQIVRASDVGAPHQRARIFIIAYPTSEDYKGVDGRKEGLEAKLLPTPTAMHVRNHDEPLQAYEQRVMDYKQGKTKGKPGASTGVAVRLLPTPTTQEGSGMCRDYRSDLTHPMICACKKYQIHWSVVN